MKKKIFAFMVIIAMLAICFGATLAYFTDEAKVTNVMTMGSIDIDQIEQERGANGQLQEFTQNKLAIAAVGTAELTNEKITLGANEFPILDDSLENVIDKFVTVKNTGKNDAYVRTIVAIEAPGFDPKGQIGINANTALGVAFEDWKPVTIDGTDYIYAVFTYTAALKPGDISPASLLQLYLDPMTTQADVVDYEGTWEVLCLSQAVQTDGFADAATALNTAFGAASAANVASWLN